MSEVPRRADEKICFMGAPSVHEGESVDIDIDSGCLPVNIGVGHVSTARHEAQHVWRSPRCGWW